MIASPSHIFAPGNIGPPLLLSRLLAYYDYINSMKGQLPYLVTQLYRGIILRLMKNMHAELLSDQYRASPTRIWATHERAEMDCGGSWRLSERTCAPLRITRAKRLFQNPTGPKHGAARSSVPSPPPIGYLQLRLGLMSS